MKDAQERFVHWQSMTIAQLGYALNLVLALAGASLAFTLSEIKTVFQNQWGGKYFLVLAAIALILSVVLGLWCTWNRLTDFRKTKNIARDEMNCSTYAELESIQPALDVIRSETDALGRRTWRLFEWQLKTFGIGAGFLVLAFLVNYSRILF